MILSCWSLFNALTHGDTFYKEFGYTSIYKYTINYNRSNMKFNDLPEEEKQKIHEEVVSASNSVGGQNFFLKMLEDVRSEKPKPLLNKASVWHYENGKMTWTKTIFKDTLDALFNAMRKEERDGDMLNGSNPKEYKSTMNMMKALRPITLTVTPKKIEDALGFSFTILDASQEKKTKTTMMYKIIFFYNIDFAKEVLAYNIKKD